MNRLKEKIKLVRRNYWRDRVMDLGPLINEAHRERTALVDVVQKDDRYAASLESAENHLRYLERRRDGYLDNLRSTA